MALSDNSTSQKYRLVTRRDLNGLACVALLKMLGIIDHVEFTHDREIEAGRFTITGQDITAGLPYNDNVHLAFDYYAPHIIQRRQVVDYSAASAARAIYNYYNCAKELPDFPVDILRAVDRATLAQYPIEEVLYPEGWDLLSFMLDHRTRLDRYLKFKESNEDLIRQIADQIDTVSIDNILEWPNVKERVAVYREQEPMFKVQIESHNEINNNLVTVDLRNEPFVYAGNRFIVYAMFPHIAVSMTIVKGRRDKTYEISLGKSIFGPTSSLHLGRLMEKYGGGGHAGAGACTIDEKDVDFVKDALTAKITLNKPARVITPLPEKTISPAKYRLVTRRDLNGLACVALLKMLGIVDRVEFTYDRNIESGRFPITEQDITAGLPYNDKVHLAFNYYAPHIVQRKQIVDYSAASTARVIYNHYNCAKELPDFPVDILRAVDRATLAQYPIEDVLQPEGWDLLSFLLDHRTGIERYTNFDESNEDLIRQIADQIDTVSIDNILEWPNVKERVAIYREQEPMFKEQIKIHHKINNNLVTVDLRNESIVYAGNRFIVYAMFPHVAVSMTIMKGRRDKTYEISLGKSIFSRTSSLHLGRLMEKYGGGGHAGAAGCVIDENNIENVKDELVANITYYTSS